MDYSLVTHELKRAISVEGRQYKLDTRTIRALQAYAVMAEEDETIPDEVRTGRILELMLDTSSLFKLRKNPEDAAELYRGIASFLQGWPEEGRKPGKHSPEEIFSYSEDHALIVAAFRQAYGIDLVSLRNLHWWEFRALLQGIPDTTVLSRVMGIRAMDIDPKDPPKVKVAKNRAKAAVAIKRKGGREKTGEDIISDAFSGL